MNRNLLYTSLITAVLLSLASSHVLAQPGPLRKALEGNSTLPRLPDDNIEGAMWQYRATRRGSDEDLTGKFRVDEKLVFSVQREVEAPKRGSDDDPLKKIISGEGGKVKLPDEPTEKRIGECKTLSSGRVRIDFQPESGLEGFMIVRPKKDATQVWWGTFQAMNGKKKGPRWNVELRKAED